jgi:hypothetical protein
VSQLAVSQEASVMLRQLGVAWLQQKSNAKLCVVTVVPLTLFDHYFFQKHPIASSAWSN